MQKADLFFKYTFPSKAGTAAETVRLVLFAGAAYLQERFRINNAVFPSSIRPEQTTSKSAKLIIEAVKSALLGRPSV